MSVPSKVLEMEKEADRAIEEAQRRQDAASKPQVDFSQEAPAPVLPSVEGPEAEVIPPVEPAIVAEPVAPVAPVNGEGLQLQLDRERQLRKTLEGRLRSQLKPANEEIKRLRKELNEVQETITAAQTKDKKSGAETYLNDEEAADLGDVLDINTRMVKGILEESLGAVSIEDAVKAVMQKNHQESDDTGPAADFWPIVDQLVPGSRELNRNDDPRWLQYLDQYSTSTGMLNRDVAEEAISNDDPYSLADLFAEFMRVYGIDQAEIAVTPVTTPAPRPERGGGGRQVETPATQQIPVWTQPEVAAFYTDVSKGKFAGRKAEADKLEAEIMAAANAGLIR